MRWSHAAYGCGVPDKRQTSKQRRAARNRAYREAMAARRENAATEARERSTRAASSSSSSSSSSTRGAARGAAVGGGRSSGIAGALFGRANGVGDTAVLLTLLFALAAGGLSLYVAFSSKSVPVDHSGDAISSWPAVSRQAYAVLHDTDVVTKKTTLVDAYGPVIPIFALLPALVAVGAFVSHRRQPRSRPLTFALVAMALVSVFNLFAMYFLPALISLAFAGFQVRKTEAPVARGGGRGQPADDEDVIDVDEVEPEEDDLEDEYDEDEYDEDEDVDEDEYEDEDLEEDEDDSVQEDEDDGVRAEADTDEREGNDDVLAELEAEIGDEGEPGEGEGEGEPEPEAGTGGRRRRSGGRSSGR
jgi:uncharacterized membrane protein YgcG